MTDRLTSLSWLVVIAVAASALISDMGFHTPVGTDDVLPLLATLVGAGVLLMRPLPDPGPMVLTLIALLALAVCANILVNFGIFQSVHDYLENIFTKNKYQHRK